MNVYLYSTIGTDWGLEIVPHWIEHYSKLGIPAEHFRLVLHSRDDRASLLRARNVLEEFEIVPQFEWIGEFSSGENYKVRKRVFSECRMEPDDWFLIADSDEFHQFPGPVAEFLTRCKQSGHNAVEAKMIDRVTSDGSLAAISAQPSLAEQFPRESDITESLLRMNPYKIIAHQRDTFSGRLHRANHGIAPEFQNTTKVYQGDCTVAHYKWTGGVIERLEHRVRHYYEIGRATDARKSEEFLELVREHGRLPLASSTLARVILSR